MPTTSPVLLAIAKEEQAWKVEVSITYFLVITVCSSLHELPPLSVSVAEWAILFQQLQPLADPELGMTVASTLSLSFFSYQMLLGPQYILYCSPDATMQFISSVGWWILVIAYTSFGQYFWVVFIPILHSKRGREGEAQFTINNYTISQKNTHLKHRKMYKINVDFWLEFCFQPVWRVCKEVFSGLAEP